MPMPTASSRRATTSRAARFSATNSTRLPSATAWVSRLVMVCDLPVPGGPSSTNVRPAPASAIARSCEASAGAGSCAARSSRSTKPAGVAGRVGERLGRLVHEVGDQRVVGEVRPVLVEVLPQPELRELQDREVRRRLDPVGQPVPDQRHPHRLERGVEVERRAVGRLGQRRDGEAVQLAQLLQQAVVRRARAGLVEGDPVGAGAAQRREGDRDEHQRAAQRAAVELPHQAAERQVEVVGAGLLEHRLRLVGDVAQPGEVAAGGDVGVHLAAVDQQLGQLRLGQLPGAGDAAFLLHGGQLVGRQQGDRRPVVDEVLQRAERRVRHGQRQAGALGVVDQPVAQAEVEQRVLPLLHPRRRLGPVRRRGRRRLGLRGRAVQRRPVLDDLQDAVLVAGPGRQRVDAVLAGAVDVGDAEDPVELAGQPAGVDGPVQVGAGLARCR